jgi:hypothetical protein
MITGEILDIMRILILSIIYTLAASFSFAAVNNVNAKADTTVVLTQQYSLETGLPNSNYIAINQRNASRHFVKVITLYNNLASKSLKKGSLKDAEETLLKKSIPLSLRYGNDLSNYNCFMALAKVYVDQKKYTQAKWYFIQSNTSALKGKNSKGQVMSLIKLAHVKGLVGDKTLALQDLKQAEKIAIKTNYKSSLPEIRKAIASLSENKEAAKTLASVAKSTESR